MRLIDGNEDVVRIVLAKGAEVGEQVVQVGHGEGDARNFRCCRERGFAHVKECVLNAHAVMSRKLLEQGRV